MFNITDIFTDENEIQEIYNSLATDIELSEEKNIKKVIIDLYDIMVF